jgi:hypothetical protein
MITIRDERFSMADEAAISTSVGACAGAAATRRTIEAATARIGSERIRIVMSIPRSILKCNFRIATTQ